MVKDLLPIEAYERPDPALSRRTALVTAVMWGTPMTALMLAIAGRTLGVAPVLIVGAVAGLGFGTWWTASFQKTMRKMTRRIHGGDPAIVPPPPPGQDYRLACSYLPTPMMAIGGHLYAAPDALTFVPHKKNLRRHQAPRTFRAGPGLALEPFDFELNRLQKLFARSPARRLRILGEGVDAVIATPDPDEVAGTLRRYYQSAAASPSARNG